MLCLRTGVARRKRGGHERQHRMLDPVYQPQRLGRQQRDGERPRRCRHRHTTDLAGESEPGHRCRIIVDPGARRLRSSAPTLARHLHRQLSLPNAGGCRLLRDARPAPRTRLAPLAHGPRHPRESACCRPAGSGSAPAASRRWRMHPTLRGTARGMPRAARRRYDRAPGTPHATRPTHRIGPARWRGSLSSSSAPDRPPSPPAPGSVRCRQASEQIRLSLDGRGLVAAVPQCAGAAVGAVDVLHVAAAERDDQSRHCGGTARREQQVHVVGRQRVGVQRTAGLRQRRAQPVQIAMIVFFGEEAGFAVMAALDNVQRDTVEVSAGGEACGNVTSNKSSLALLITL